MLFFRAALGIAVVTAATVTGLSLGSGFPMEVALLRGLLMVFPVIGVGYAMERIASAPPRPRRAVRTSRPDVEPDEPREPVDLAAVRETRDAESSRRAA